MKLGSIGLRVWVFGSEYVGNWGVRYHFESPLEAFQNQAVP